MCYNLAYSSQFSPLRTAAIARPGSRRADFGWKDCPSLTQVGDLLTLVGKVDWKEWSTLVGKIDWKEQSTLVGKIDCV